LAFGRGEVRRVSGVLQATGTKVAIFAFGTLLYPALEAAQKLDASVVNMRWAKPLDEALLLDIAASHDVMVTVEDGAKNGGAGSAVLECLARAALCKPTLVLGLEDAFIEHGDPHLLMSMQGLNAQGIVASIHNFTLQIAKR
jgi:1-deoxy-D-xylulose-5-phosphate synthase